MTIIGLTGPTGSGKSSCSAYLSSVGIPTIDADRIYHDLIASPSPCTAEIVKEFGESVLDACGGINRKALAAIVGIFYIVIVGIIDAVFTSMFVYMFAYFSNNNAKYAIESGDTTSAPKTLKILSLIEMIFAAIIAIAGGLLIIAVFAFM